MCLSVHSANKYVLSAKIEAEIAVTTPDEKEIENVRGPVCAAL